MSRHLPGHVLASLASGDLSASRVAEAASHLRSCSKCQAARVYVEASRAAMEQIRGQGEPDLLWDEIGAQVYWQTSQESRSQDPARRHLFSWASGGVPLAVASGLALVAAAALYWSWPGDAGLVAPELVASSTSVLDPAARAREKAQEQIEPQAVSTEGLAAKSVVARPVRGIVVLVQGPVLANGQALRANDLVEAGAQFSTGTGRLVIQFGEQSALRVAPHSVLTIERFDEARIALRILGRVDVDITRRLPGQEFAVLAGGHEVSVRGTAFRVDFEDGQLGVRCIRGKVVVSDGEHGVQVPAGQQFEVFRRALDEVALRSVPIDREKLVSLGHAMQMPMLLAWRAPSELLASTALLELESEAQQPIAVDGTYVAQGPFTLRTTPGAHEVALVRPDGGLVQTSRVRAVRGVANRAHLLAPRKARGSEELEARVRKHQLRLALASSSRITGCLEPLAKRGLLAGSYLSLDVGINKDGSQSFLNLVSSNLSSALQSCLRDAVSEEELPSGPDSSFRFRLSY